MTADSSEMVRTRESGREREEARRGKRGEDKRESRKISSAIKHQREKGARGREPHSSQGRVL
jgi:hypothetical protein